MALHALRAGPAVDAGAPGDIRCRPGQVPIGTHLNHLVAKATILDAAEMARVLRRIAGQILEAHGGAAGLMIVGIRTRGVPMAETLCDEIERLEGVRPPLGILDITLYRDDLMHHPVGPQPVVRSTEIPFSIDDRVILLVDDVLYTGRTIRAALDELIDFGRPRAIQLVVIVDRGHRELPIKADYVGKNLPTSHTESVAVRLVETDGCDEVVIEKIEEIPA